MSCPRHYWKISTKTSETHTTTTNNNDDDNNANDNNNYCRKHYCMLQ